MAIKVLPQIHKIHVKHHSNEFSKKMSEGMLEAKIRVNKEICVYQSWPTTKYEMGVYHRGETQYAA